MKIMKSARTQKRLLLLSQPASQARLEDPPPPTLKTDRKPQEKKQERRFTDRLRGEEGEGLCMEEVTRRADERDGDVLLLKFIVC